MIKTQFSNPINNSSLGIPCGFYAPSRETVRKVQYETALLDSGTTTKNRFHATNKGGFTSKRKLDEVQLPRNYLDIKTPIYQQYFQKPVRCNNSPAIDKISWKEKEVFFGIIKDKLAIYSTYLHNGKKEMKLYGVEKLTATQIKDKQYLRARATRALNNLLEQDTQKQNNPQQIYEVNHMRWANFSPQDLKKHLQGEDYSKYDVKKDTWGEDKLVFNPTLNVA